MSTTHDETFVLSEDSGDLDVDFRAYEDSLIPKKCAASPYRTLRFYYLWFNLLLIHFICFFSMPTTVKECQNTQ